MNSFLNMKNDESDFIFFENIRKQYYSRLDKNNIVYLDFAGSSLHNEKLLQNYVDYMNDNVNGNPHSSNIAAQNSEITTDKVRFKIQKFLNASNYELIFTANSSKGLKLIGENFDYDNCSYITILKDNHNSMHGLREHAKEKNKEYIYFNKFNELDEYKGPKLICFPYQSNATGANYADKFIRKNEHDIVLVDMAAAVSHKKIDLNKLNYDFVVFSINKILGFPTGVGCLLIKKSSMKYLKKKYFSGGSAASVLVEKDYYELHNNYRSFEDGTINFSVHKYIEEGIDFINEIKITRINKYICILQNLLYIELKKLKHSNGKDLIGINNYTRDSGIINFNVYDYNGNVWESNFVDHILSEDRICIRSGFHCNSYHIEKSDPFLKNGSLRISLSFINVKRDIENFLNSVRKLLDCEANYEQY